MSSREEFEAWLSSEYPWGNEALDKAFFSGNDDNGYYTGGDFIYDGSSCADGLFWAWRGWQESHKQGKTKCAALAAEVQTVKTMNDCLSEELRGYESDGAFEGPKMHLLWWKAETPATDALLAEVRASGVEAAIATAKNVVAQEFQYKDFETAQRVCSKFPESDLVGKVEMVEWLEDFAAQLRQGGAE